MFGDKRDGDDFLSFSSMTKTSLKWSLSSLLAN